MPPTPLALSLTHITKHFGVTAALTDAHLAVRPNTIHALLGENGAGKTTLMKIAFGMLAPDQTNSNHHGNHGEITLHGAPVRFTSPADAIAAGIGMVHQHFMLVPAMTVAENIALGGMRRRRDSAMPTSRVRLDLRAVREHVRSVSRHAGLPIDPDAVVGTLPVGAQQRVEILKALARDATVLILDEPTAVLAPSEARELLERVRRFAATEGTVILITHKLRDALEYADDVTVLRHGATVLTTRASDVRESQLAEAMLGTERMADGMWEARGAPRPPAPVTPRAPAAPLLALDRVTVVADNGTTRLSDVTLQVYGGEIVGIAAVEGNGEQELLRVLAGRLAPTRGTVTRPASVGFVPEDRQRDALILDFSLTDNVALRDAGARRGRMSWRAYQARTAELLARYDIRAPGPASRARALSGGNQQKLVIAREFERAAFEHSDSDAASAALVAENPTRGLDIHATAAVHQRLRAARDAGAAVVMYSSDLDEVLAVADRLLVVANGRVFDAPRDRDQAGRLMVTGTSLGGSSPWETSP